MKKKAYVTKAEAISFFEKIPDDAKITGVSFMARLEHSFQSTRFGNNSTPVNDIQFVHIKDVSKQDHDQALRGKTF